MFLTRKLSLTLVTLLIIGFTLVFLPRMRTAHADDPLTFTVTDPAPGNTYDQTIARGMTPSGHIIGDVYPTGTSTAHTFVYNDTGLHDLDGLISGSHGQLDTGTRGIINSNILTNGGIENSGRVVGTFWTDNYEEQRLALYDPTTGMHDIGTLGGSFATVQAINASGEIVGTSMTDASGEIPTFHAFLYSDGTMQDIDTSGGIDSSAYAVNSSGQVVGRMFTTNGESRAFLYDSTGMHDLGTLGGLNSSAYDINDSGQVIGVANTTNGEQHAFLYDSTGMHDLGTPGGSYSEAIAINNAGQIIGYGLNANSQYVGFFYDGTSMDEILMGNGINSIDRFTESGVVAGKFQGTNGYEHAFVYDSNGMHTMTLSGGRSSMIRDMNESGQAVGESIATTGEQYAVLYDGTDLLNLTPGNVFSLGKAINSSGDVVGITETPSEDQYVFLYKDAVLTNLNALITDNGVEIYNPIGISDSGQIVVNGLNNSQLRALLLIPGE
jgi:probable HAF family extracellular repeat protein